MAFARAQAEEDLEPAVFQIPLQGDEGTGSAFLDLAKKPVDLRLMEKKFAGAIGFRVGPVPVDVGGDMEGMKPGLPVFNSAERVGKVATPRADGFDLRPGQNHSGLHGFQDGVVMTRPAVVNFNSFQGASLRRPSGRLRGFFGASLAGRLGRRLRCSSADDFVAQFSVCNFV